MENIDLIFIGLTLLLGIFGVIRKELPNLLALIKRSSVFSRIRAALSRKASFAFLPIMFSSLGISTLTSGIIKLMLSFIKIIIDGIGSMFGDIFSGFGNSVVIMLQSFGFSTASYGVLGPVVFVVGVALAILVGYAFLVPTRAEEDVVQDEDDL